MAITWDWGPGPLLVTTRPENLVAYQSLIYYSAGSSFCVYNIATDTHAPLDAVPGSSTRGLVALSDGRLVAVESGGDQLWVYDPSGGGWSTSPAHALPSPEIWCHNVVAVDTRVYVGGNPAANGQFWVFDVDTEVWTQLPAMPIRVTAPAYAVHGGVIYAVAGFESGVGAPSHIAQAFDTSSNTWVAMADPPDTSWSVWRGAAAGVDGLIYATRSNGSVIAYDPAADSWASVGSFSASQSEMLMVSSPHNGHLYVSGLTQSGDQYLVVGTGVNSPPDAPVLAFPADAATINRGVVNRFSWLFSDATASDSQSAAEVRHRAIGTPTWTVVSVDSPNRFWDAPPGSFAAGDHEWQARTADSWGAWGPWSPSGFFTAGNPPAGPTITSPSNGAVIASESADVTWSVSSQDRYQVQLLDEADAVVYDSGSVGVPTARSHGLTFPVNGVGRTVRLRVYAAGLWSTWVSVSVSVSFTRPMVPVVALTSVAGAGALVVDVSNPASGVDEPAVSYNDVYVTDPGMGEERRKTYLPPNGSWAYWTPVAGVDYAPRVRVVAVGENGATSTSVVPVEEFGGGHVEQSYDIEIGGGTP